MRKLLVTSIVALSTTLFLSAANAGGFERVNNTRLHYKIDHDTCKVTLKTNRNIRRITQRDAYGNIVKRWSTKKGERLRLFDDFDKFPVSLTEGTIKVKTGYKHRVKFQEIGDQFRRDLTDCFTKDPVDPVDPLDPLDPLDPGPELAVCPANVVSAIDAVIASTTENALSIFDNENSCSVFGDATSVAFFNGLSLDAADLVGVEIDQATQQTLSLEEVDACVLATGRCNNFNNLLPE